MLARHFCYKHLQKAMLQTKRQLRTGKEGLSLSSGLVVSGHRQNELALNG